MKLIVDSIKGTSPIEAEGTVGSYLFFFQANNNKWWIGLDHERDNTFYPSTAIWSMICSYPNAGNMTEDEVKRILYFATDHFKLQHFYGE